MGVACSGCARSVGNVAQPQRVVGVLMPPAFSPKALDPMPFGPTLLQPSEGAAPRKAFEAATASAAPTEAASPRSSGAPTPRTEGQAAGSLNTIVEFLWPRISSYASELVITEVQPALQATLPSPLKTITFDKGKCHLGQRPLEFVRLHVKRNDRGSLQNLIFEARVEWDADCSVYLNFAGQGMGIRGLRIKGVLLLELVGLMDQPPFFEGLRAFFVNPPDIDVEFQGAGEGLLNLHLIRSKIVDVVAKGINAQLVLPNRIGYAMAHDCDRFSIKCPPAEGILRVTVVAAKDLLAMDRTWFGRPSSDPYVLIRCGAHEFRSPTKYKTLNPTFGFVVFIPVSDVSNQHVLLEMYDEDFVSADDFLGKLSVPVRTMQAWGKDKQVTLELGDATSAKGHNGSLTVSAEWSDLHSVTEVAGAPLTQTGLIFVGVSSAARLLRQGTGTQYWVTVRCDGVLADFPGAKRTKKVKEVPLPKDALNTASAADIRARLGLLMKYGMSEDEMAQILQVDETVLRECMLSRSASEAAGELARLDATAFHEVRWDGGFEFPVAAMSGATVTLEVMSQAKGKQPQLLGTCTFAAAEAANSPSGTSWTTRELTGSSVLLRLKMSLRYAGQCVSSI